MYAEPDDRVGAERGADERQPDKRQHAADLRVARYRRPERLQRDRVNDGQPRQVSEERPHEAGGPRVLKPTVVLSPTRRAPQSDRLTRCSGRPSG